MSGGKYSKILSLFYSRLIFLILQNILNIISLENSYEKPLIMKKASGIVLKILLGLVIAIVIFLFLVPVVFKDKIKTTIEKSVSESVNSKLSIEDYKFGFFRNFPKLTLSLDGLSLSGIDEFEGDTLLRCKSVSLVFNLGSLFKKTGYEVKSLVLQDASLLAMVNRDGKPNWDIMKESESETGTPAGETESAVKILLRQVKILNSSIAYIDKESDMEAFLRDLNASMSGDLTSSVTNLEIRMKVGDVTYLMDGIRYLNKAVADADVHLKANLDSMKFYLADNYLLLNDMLLNFEGMVAMPGDDIETDLAFKSGKTSLKSLMSLIPSVYMSGYENLRTEGEFTFEGTAKGVYSDADSTIPDVALSLNVSRGLVSYPSLPEKIRNINIKSDVYVDGRDMDKTTVDVSKFHMELAGNPFDMSLSLKTPMSDPDFNASVNGKIDLTALSKAVPLDSISLSGLIDVAVKMAGKMSMLDNKQYDRFSALGNLNVSNMAVEMTGYPGIKIEKAGFEISPSYALLKDTKISVGNNSDFSLAGKLENYIPYLFKGEIIRGNLSLQSNLVDLTEIMSGMKPDSTTNDTSSLSVIKIPENIDFNFNAAISRFKYNNIDVKNLKGNINVRNGVLSIKDAGMDFLGGKIAMDADYDTRDSLKPMVRAGFSMENIGVKDAFNSFNTIQKLAPAAKGINGKVGIRLSYSSLLGKDFMPLISSISGSGKLTTNEVTLVESVAYNKIKETLKLNENYSNTFRDLNISFRISDGRIIVSPFNTKVGNIKMNISGDQGIDQTINYIVKTEIPRADLGNSVNALINNLSAQASSFGLAFKPSDILKVNVKITGTFLKPLVTPVFGSASPDSSGVTSTVRESVKNAVEEHTVVVKEKVRGEAEIQADRLVREAEDKASLLREEAARSAEKMKLEADQQAQKLIKEAEPKGTVARLAAQKAADAVRKEAERRAGQIVKEADAKATKMVDEAKAKRQDMLDKLQ